VAVTALPDNLQCIIGNTLFTQYFQFQDIIKVHTPGTPARPALIDHDYTDDCAAGDRHGSAEPVGASSTTVIDSETSEQCGNDSDHEMTQISINDGQGNSSCGTDDDGQLAAGLVNVTPRLINREMREQPSGGVDLNETDKPINNTDGSRRRPVDEGTLFSEPTAVDTAEKPAAEDGVIDMQGSHTCGAGGDCPWREMTATSHAPPSGPTRPESTQTSVTNTDKARRRPDVVTPLVRLQLWTGLSSRRRTTALLTR